MHLPYQKKFLFLCALLFAGCSTQNGKIPPNTFEEIHGRDEILSFSQRVRRPVYRAKVPCSWKRMEDENQSLLDTKKPIVTFALGENLLLSVHNFPSDSLEKRIPLLAQIERWEQQLAGGESHIEQIGHSGFTGFFFEGKKGENLVLAWAMQLDPELYQRLHFLAASVEEEEHYKQMSADYTIKISGPRPLIEKYREEIEMFAQSFELIQEIPAHM
jgi:hypothetical protein